MTKILRPGIPTVFESGKDYVLRCGTVVTYINSFKNRLGFRCEAHSLHGKPRTGILVTDLDGKCVDHEIPPRFREDFDVVGEA